MSNSKTISCSLDEKIDLPDDWIKLKVSSKGYWGYVCSEEILECTDCPECPEVHLIDESGNVDSMASNTTSSTNSYNTGLGGTGMVLVPTATTTATVIPEQTTKLATAKKCIRSITSIAWIRCSIIDMHVDFSNNHPEEINAR